MTHTKHDRDLERAAARFEEAEKELYRRDGRRYYGDQEHAEREGRLASEFGERVDAIISEAEEEAARHEEQALALSYEDPTAGLSSTERSRLADSRVFVQEDCAELPLTALLERLRAVSLGSDEAAKVLHARYARRRLEAEDAAVDDRALRGAPDTRPEDEREAHRRLGTLVEGLAESVADQGQKKRRQAALDKARESREAAARVRRKLMEIDGTDRWAAEETRQRLHGVL